MENLSVQALGSDSAPISRVVSAAEAVQTRNYYEGPVDINGDVRIRRRYFTYKTDAGLVAGSNSNVMFTIDRPAKDVWPYFKDFNLWQNLHRHYYSGVVGDLEGKTFSLSDKPNDSTTPHQYQGLRVIPEHLIVIFQPVPEDGGNGGVSPGFHVFMLNEHDGKTVVTILMEHASRTMDKTEEEALGYWRDVTLEWQRKWRDDFIPTLKKLIYKDNK